MGSMGAWPETALDAIERTAREILERVGVDVQSGSARDLMIAAGCRPLANDRLGIPWPVVEAAAEAAPRRFVLAARDRARGLAVDADEAPPWTHPLGGAPYVCDVATGEQRRAQPADVAGAARVQHSLQYPDLVTPLFMPDGVPGDLEPLLSYVVCLQETDKCVSGPALWSVEQVRGLCRLAEAVVGPPAGSDRAVNLAFSPLSPLALAGNVADALVEAARLGASCVLLPCPVAGTTGPAPIAAAVAQQLAEALVGVVLVEAAQPGTAVICGSRLMPCDSATGAAVMGGPEMGRASQAMTLVLRRLGLPCDVYGLATDSRVIDVQFGFERAIGLLSAAMALPAFVSGMGFMQSGVGGSLEALAIDDEICRWVQWSLSARPVDEAALDVDAIQQAVSGGSGFLGLRQTRTYMRTEKAQSRLAFRSLQQEWMSGRDGMLERSRRSVTAALAQEPVGLDDDVIRMMSGILVESAKRMGIEETPDLSALLEECRAAAGSALA